MQGSVQNYKGMYVYDDRIETFHYELSNVHLAKIISDVTNRLLHLSPNVEFFIGRLIIKYNVIL